MAWKRQKSAFWKSERKVFDVQKNASESIKSGPYNKA